MGTRIRCIVLFTSFALTSCTVLDGTSRDGIHLGLVVFKQTGADELDVQREIQTSVGIWTNRNSLSSSNSFGVGWQSSKLVAATDNCRIVFLVDDATEAFDAINLIQSELGERDDLCIEDP